MHRRPAVAIAATARPSRPHPRPAVLVPSNKTRQAVSRSKYIGVAAAIAVIAAIAALILAPCASWPSRVSSHLLLGRPPPPSSSHTMPRDRTSKAQRQQQLEPQAPRTFADGGPLPACLVFDLDYTLWPFWIDTHVDGPLRDAPAPNDKGRFALDARGMELRFYRDVPAVLAGARAAGVKVAAASRTHAPELARRLLGLLRIPPAPVPKQADQERGEDEDEGQQQRQQDEAKAAASFFDDLQIYPGDKRRHLRRISEALDTEYDEILFFDDESRNRNVEELGVHFAFVGSGVDAGVVDGAVEAWRKRQRRPR